MHLEPTQRSRLSASPWGLIQKNKLYPNIHSSITYKLPRCQSIIYSNIDRLGGRYAKQSTSDRERQILHHTTYMWKFKDTTD